MIVVVRPEPSLPSSVAFFSQQGIACQGIAVQDIQTIEPPAGFDTPSAAPTVIVVTSQYAAPQAIEYITRYEWSANDIRLIAVGDKTKAALGTFAQSCLVPQRQTSEGVIAQYGSHIGSADRVYIFKGEGGRHTLEQTFSDSGAEVTSLSVYKRISTPLSEDDRTALLKADCIVTTNAESIPLLLDSTPAYELIHKSWVVPSDRVASTATQMGIKSVYISAGASDAALLKCIHQILE